MIKKHLIACIAVVLITVLAKVGISKTSVTHVKSFPQKVDVPSPRDEKESSPVISFEFASEEIPVQHVKVSQRMKKYLKASSYEHIQTNRLHHKAARWFPLIEPILEQYGIPEDFKYLPLVESGLNGGTSPKGASGYWQFMPQTARSYGLVVNRTRDDRQNMRKSTIAAAKYLRDLYKEFNNWTLVAAAYNVGENSLKRQIAVQGHDNYFKLRLNRETASYVYKLASMKEVIENPIKYGFAQRGESLLARDVEQPKHRVIDPVTERNAIDALNLLRKQDL